MLNEKSASGRPAAGPCDVTTVSAMADPLTSQTVNLLQQLIRNRCVNDGTPGSGEEIRNSDLLETFLEGSGLDVERFDASSRCLLYTSDAADE